MSKRTKTVCVIPARGGSKRLPGKNVIDLAGKPLIAHTIEAAIDSECFEKIIVSTDDDSIAEVGRGYKDVTIDHRNPDLGGDKVKVVDVITEICLREDINSVYDIIAMMLPTAPFRRKQDVLSGFSNLTDQVDAVVSFAPYEFSPTMAVELTGPEKNMAPIFNPSPLVSGNTRSQDQIQMYRPNGSFYFTWIQSFLKQGSFYRGRVRGIAMSRLGSIDIDEREDLDLARLIAKSPMCESDYI